jgi:hypothetical protein
MPLPDGEQLSAVAREAAESGQVVYLTDRGRRLAAIVPAELAELLERGGKATGGRRVLGARAAGRSGRHDISERIEEILRSEVGAIALVVDAGPLYAYVDADDQHHQECAELLEIHPGPLIVPTLVVTEVVYLLGTRLGASADAVPRGHGLWRLRR